jgi:hypothetical protein
MIKDILKSLLSDEPEKIPFETQLQSLKDSGILPNENVTDEVIISELEKLGFDGHDTENDPSLLLVVFGSSREVDDGVFEANSKDVLYLDTKCVQESDIYLEVLSSLLVMAKGSLELNDVEEFLDLENFDAHVSFTYKGKPYKWELRVAQDNFDMTLLVKLNNMLADENSEKSFYIQCSEETVIIIFSDKNTVKKLNKTLNLGFEIA